MKASNAYYRTGKGKFTAIVTFLLAAALLAACAAPTGMQGQPAGSEKGESQAQPLSGQAQPAPQMETTARNQADSANPAGGGEEEGAINSSGTAVAPGTPSGQKGLVQIGGSSGDEGSISSREVDWNTYTDEVYGFSLLYPDNYVILPEGKLDQYTGEKPVRVVRFQDEAIAKGDTADREPPQFSIEIFARPAALDLKNWIQSNRLAPSNVDYESVELAGAQEGLKVSMNTLMAPNVFYYFSTEKLIYRIIPLGEYSQEMLASFKLPKV